MEALDKLRQLQLRLRKCTYPSSTSTRTRSVSRHASSQNEGCREIDDSVQIHQAKMMEKYHRIGYMTDELSTVSHWQQMLDIGCDLFESRSTLYRCIARIRAGVPFISESIAYCALVENLGNVPEAIEKLHAPSYKKELEHICAAINVQNMLQNRFPKGSTLPVSSSSAFPQISPPSARPKSKKLSSSTGKFKSRSSFKPMQSPGKSPLCDQVGPSKGLRRPLRLNQIIDHRAQEYYSHSPYSSSTESFQVYEDFREANTAILSNQKAFRS